MDSNIYPTRSFIRFSAKSQLAADLSGRLMPVYIERNGIEQSDMVQPAASNGNDAGAYCEVFQAESESLDEALFRRIVQEAFAPDRHPELYRTYPSEAAAAAVEAQMANNIVQAYKQVCLQQRQAVVESFNALLAR